MLNFLRAGRKLRTADGWNALRRRSAMWADRRWAVFERRRTPTREVPFDGDPRLAIVTVNFSTTRELKLMLLTLSEQDDLDLVERLLIVDNGSRDGGQGFLLALAARVPRVHVVERRRWLHHGPALRAGVYELERVDATDQRPANVLLFCDPDVVFLQPEALITVASCFVVHGAALVGEARPGRSGPDIQASFVAVRREVLSRPDIAPICHDGSPTYHQQRTIAAAGLTVVDLPTNRNGLVLHKGRAGVAAAQAYRPGHAYATVRTNEPHFMGVPGGEATWAAVEARHAGLLAVEREVDLLDLLAVRFATFGGAKW